MKKILFFAVVAVATMLVACGGGDAAKSDPFVTYRGVTSYSGTFYKAFDFSATEKDSIVYDVQYDGEKAVVNIPITFVRSQEDLPEGELTEVEVVVRGSDDLKDFEMRTKASDEELAKLKGILDKKGEKVVVTFTKEMLKQDIDKIKGQKVWTSILM